MSTTVYIGMDVHSTNYTLSSYVFEEDKHFATAKLSPETDSVLSYVKRIRREYEQTVKILAVLSPENERQSVRIGELLKRKELLEEALSIYRTDTGTAGFGLRAGSEAEARSQGE